jgi:tetratricopeptide (TPR) repeat protein
MTRPRTNWTQRRSGQWISLGFLGNSDVTELLSQSFRMTPATIYPRSPKRFLLSRGLLCFLIGSTLGTWSLNSQVPLAVLAQIPSQSLQVPELKVGFHFLYQLKFAEARDQFALWQESHPEDPLGSVSEAASFLFEECYRQGILTSAFFLDDKRFLGKIALKPDPELRAPFFAADKRAQELAQLRLKTAPTDTTALFAMALSLGMQADYASLIDKQQLESLKMTREADKYAQKLLAINPEAADAYLGLGTANFVIGSLPGYKRFALGFIGIHGDKILGIRQLEVAADKGYYLRPFAKVLLALAALRERKKDVARKQFKELVVEFPENPFFTNELVGLGP